MAVDTGDHGIAWAKRLMENDKERHDMCDKFFAEEDKDNSGYLDADEVAHLIKRITGDMHIKTPEHQRVREMVKKVIKASDENRDHVLNLKEFRTAFKITIKSCLAEAERELAEENTPKEENVPKEEPKGENFRGCSLANCTLM
eukprot:TRINITY_DN13183_c0_g2_i1.p1 TRINITY_DN13183_c0_g2~~TRINITY_DN13183_c0_g2_i1.p1  ORF type:complete len:163 (-),score=45.93 TRINITY_DN13183_c0_g2_i1:189-620(-)